MTARERAVALQKRISDLTCQSAWTGNAANVDLIDISETLPAVYWPLEWLVDAIDTAMHEARAEEREACARIAELQFIAGHSVVEPHWSAGVAAMIRARNTR